MWTPLIYTVIIAILFAGYLVLAVAEERRGRRFLLKRARTWFDLTLDSLSYRVHRAARYVVKYMITLSWYYSLHAFLKVVLQFLGGVYHVVEAVLIRNRERARLLRKEKRTGVTHLTQIADHKEEVKLTPAEARKRKDKALKGH